MRFNNSYALRRGATVAEVLVAIAILGVAGTGIGRFVSSSNAGLRQLQLQTLLGWELGNGRERVGSWPADQVTEEAINERLDIGESVHAALPGAHWLVNVDRVEHPAAALRVTLQLEYPYRGQTVRSAELSFWRPLPEVDASQDVPNETDAEEVPDEQ